MQIKYISYSSANRPGLLRKAVALISTVVLAALALMFSAVLLTVILIIVVFGGAYLWWKTRELRKLMRKLQLHLTCATMRSDGFAAKHSKAK